jgi:lipoprotein-anchoring transpeptidase ErfK/SrfK
MYVDVGRHGDGYVSKGKTVKSLVGSLVGVAVVAVLALAGCSSDPGPAPAGELNAPNNVGGGQQAAPPVVKPAANIKISPGAGATDVSPAQAIGVAVTDGTIETVTLTNPEGKQVTGKLSDDKTAWTVAEPLGYGKTYTWAGTALGTDGKSTTITGQFTTVKPKRTVRGTINTGDGQTFGVAQPIAITFDAPVTDKAAVQKALTVQASVPTEGSWAWLNDRSVHWRPKAYWTPGTKVTVSAKLYGLAYGNGSFGRDDLTSHFTIGRSLVAKANAQTHRFVVIKDGVQIADYPASYGLDSDPGRVTKSGIHVVINKSETYFMNNPAYDYENVEVHWAVRISNNGEFTHGAPWSVGQQGKRNVSHGCANLSTANAKAYFDMAIAGDPVEIVGTTQQLSAKDGDYYDWAFSWANWVAKSAV